MYEQREPRSAVSIDPNQAISAQGRTASFGSRPVFPIFLEGGHVERSVEVQISVCPFGSGLLRYGCRGDIDAWMRHNDPTGKSPKSLSIPHAKNKSLNPSGKSAL
jgi:hypothetical protein